MKLKKGDKVVVIAGKSKGMAGSIVRAMPQSDMVLIDGVNVVKRHRRANRQGAKGQIIDKPMPIHVSNVMLADPKDGKPTRIKLVREEGKVSRIAVKSGTAIK